MEEVVEVIGEHLALCRKKSPFKNLEHIGGMNE